MTALRFTIIFLGLLLLGCDPSPNESANVKTIEKQIWALEHSYIVNHRNADFENLFSAWHDKFLGWPDNLTDPADKDAVIVYIRQRYPVPKSWNFQIDPKGIQVHGDIVINHYILHIAGTSTRVTHTWIREDSQWKILGGMSNRH
jgi:ketosteroid isomerase-like protein